MVGFTWFPISNKVKATTRYWQNAIAIVPNARWYRWNEEAEYERLAIIFEPPMGENIDEGLAVNPVVESMDEEDNAARDEGEEEEDTEGVGSEERNESLQEEEDDDDGGYSDLERMHSDFRVWG
ncbi:hypothetical protein Salat_2436800 [Sesamum alatum]|uniref:Uncharacterized protein n=1 Tax=Sesamum alatum TaxID=300844 RepID=A0AAE1XZA9_9LAMI|nr:hypothetical protein Salat_2436800 [Sesamum alatum]